MVTGINPTAGDLLEWLCDDPKRRMIWRIVNSKTTGFPDTESEWCVINLQDESKARGIAIAVRYGSKVSVKYRSHFSRSWISDWLTII